MQKNKLVILCTKAFLTFFGTTKWPLKTTKQTNKPGLLKGPQDHVAKENGGKQLNKWATFPIKGSPRDPKACTIYKKIKQGSKKDIQTNDCSFTVCQGTIIHFDMKMKSFQFIWRIRLSSIFDT